jgi:L-cysteine/cystine lyase
MARADERDFERGRTGAWYPDEILELRERVRAALARVVGAPADRVALTRSTTEGCNIVITGLRLRPDDEVVTTDAEHPGLLMPLLASGARIKHARILERPAAEALRAILDEVTPQTRLVALSHVLWLNGQVMPLADIKRETGLPLLVDGAQSAGAIAVDASVADWYTVSGQKWLCGPETTGALYVADAERLRPQIQSGFASIGTGAGRLALVHVAPAMVAGLLAAVEDVPDWGIERAAATVARCRKMLLEVGVEVRTEAGQGTLVSFRVPGDPAEVVKQAESAGVVIRNLPDGWLRASLGWWNDEADITRLVEFLTGRG